MAWYLNFFIWTLFPLGGLMLFALILPQWPFLRRVNLWWTEKVLFLQLNIFGRNITLYAVMVMLALVTFGGSVLATQRAQQDFVLSKKFGRTDEFALMRKWKSERDFWISLFALTLWLLVLRVRQMQLDISGLEAAVEVSSRIVRADREKQGWFPPPAGTSTAAGNGVSSGAENVRPAGGLKQNTAVATGVQAAVASAPVVSPPGPKFSPSTSPPGTEREESEAKKDK